MALRRCLLSAKFLPPSQAILLSVCRATRSSPGLFFLGAVSFRALEADEETRSNLKRLFRDFLPVFYSNVQVTLPLPDYASFRQNQIEGLLVR